MTVATIPDPYTTGAYALQKHDGVTAPENFPLARIVSANVDVLAPLCPPGVSVQTVVAQLYAATLRTPQLLKATDQSLIIGLSLGIPTGGVLGSDWYLLPFWNKDLKKYEVTFAFDYKFLAACIIQAGGARSIDAQVVRANDTYREVKGTAPQIIHEAPPFGKQRGAVVGFYAVAHMGATVPPRFVSMSLANVEEVRAKSKQWGPDKIRECPDWYGMARVVHRLGKLLPKKANPALQHLERVMEADARVAGAEEADATPRPPTMTSDGEDPTYEPTPTTEPPDDETVTVDLATAERMIVSKRTIGSRTHDELEKLYEWAQGKHTETGERKFLEYMAAIGTIQEARRTGEAQEPAKAPKGEA